MISSVVNKGPDEVENSIDILDEGTTLSCILIVSLVVKGGLVNLQRAGND